MRALYEIVGAVVVGVLLYRGIAGTWFPTTKKRRTAPRPKKHNEE